MPDSPYFLAVKAAHLSALVMERERCNLPVSLEDVRMFRIRAHEVATLAELAEQSTHGQRCEHEGCPDEGRPGICPFSAQVRNCQRTCLCCDDHRRECARDV